MAGKSKHHQGTNTFRFQTFHERLAAVNIDVARKLGKFAATPEDDDTFFGEALAKWTDLNLTLHFVAFRNDIQGEVQSFVQLIHNKKDVVDMLEKHLKVENSLAFTPLLDLVVQLARDLQTDFYPYFPRILHVIVQLLHNLHHNVELLEAAFTCLAHLFKFLWRTMVDDIENVYRLFSPLLSSHYRPYIKSFAAESFSFLMRKVKDKPGLFTFLFNNLTEFPKQAQGLGILLFQMIKGVKKQFHSSTARVLPQVLATLGETGLMNELVLTCQLELFTQIAKHTNHEHCQQIIACLVECTRAVHNKIESDSSNWLHLSHLTGLLKLLRVLITFRAGTLIQSGDVIAQVLQQLLGGVELRRECAHVLLDVLVEALLTPKCPLAQHRYKLINMVYNTPYDRQLLLEVTGKLFELPIKEKDLKMAVEMYCHKLCINSSAQDADVKMEADDHCVTSNTVYDDVLRLLLAWSHTLDGAISLDFTVPMRKSGATEVDAFPVWMVKQVKRVTDCPKLMSTHMCQVRAIVHCLPIVRPISDADREHVIMKVLQPCVVMCTQQQADKALGLLWETLRSLQKTVDIKTFVQKIQETVDFVELLRLHPSNVYLLKSASMFYNEAQLHSETREHVLCVEKFKHLWPLLVNNIASPHHLVRKHTLDICRQFSLPLPVISEETNLKQSSVFEICYQAETTDPGVHTYRDKLMHLRKLDFNIVHNQIPVSDPSYFEVPLRYILGVYYVNMRLLLEPIKQLITSYALGLPRDKFWGIYHTRLQYVADHTEQRLEHRDRKEKKPKHSTQGSSIQYAQTIHELMTSHTNLHCRHRDKPNHAHMRELLWTTMLSFPGVCEPRSRLLSPLLFRFLKNEFYSTDSEKSNFVSVQKKPAVNDENKQKMMDLTIESANENEDGVLDLTNEAEEIVQSVSDIQRGTASNREIVTHLKLFAKFKNPKSLSMEPALKELYLDLLSFNDVSIQKVAFECIMTYEYKYLTPYKDNFTRLLLDDAQFRTELVLFGIDAQTTAIQTDHREQLVPLLMRILYGKLQAKTLKNKMTVESKRAIIIRFLGGCNAQEFDVFLQLLLEPVKHVLDGDVAEVTHAEVTSSNMTHIVPLTKQHALLDALEVILKKIGNLVEMDLSKVLQVLVTLQAQHNRLLDNRDHVAKRYINSLKALRQLTAKLIMEFFARFVDTYNFSAHEIDAVFDAAVWPRLGKLHFEGLHSTTGLTVLFNTWTQHSRYFPLLSVVHSSDPSLTPLPHILALLGSSKVERQASSALLEIIENLLTVDDFETTDKVNVIEVSQSVALSERTDVSLGTKLILPHVTVLLNYLSTKVKALVEKKSKKAKIPERELTILSKLSEHVTDKEQSSTITHLLLPFLGRRISRKPETELHILTAITHLFARVTNPQEFVTDIAKLFSVLTNRESRAALCRTFHALAGHLPQHAHTAEMLSQTNAWDSRRVEDPDYMLRLQGFRTAAQLIHKSSATEQLLPTSAEMSSASDANEMVSGEADKPVAGTVEKNGLDFIMCIAVIHQSAFVLSTAEDMSLRDNAALCMSELIAKIAEYGQESRAFKELLVGHILPLVKERIRLNSEAARHEFINILGTLVKHFPDYPQFTALVALRNYNDVEADIFTSLTHVQLHRRAKGLRRLTKHLETSEVKVETIMHYLLPVVNAFLRDAYYTQNSSLRDASIECLGVLCQALPWRYYMPVLKQYLERLTKDMSRQKLVVRVVVTILDVFHFDLSLSQRIDQLGEGNSAKPHKPDDVTTPKTEEAADEEPELDLDIDAQDDDVTEEQSNESTALGDVTSGDVTMSSENPDDSMSKKGVNWQVCSVEQATKIHRAILQVIIPQMNRLLTAKIKSEDHHKKSGASKYAEDDEILRVPIALAMVKLLQALPTCTLQSILPSILLKICVFLRSRARDIRITARSTLVKILQSLGPNYLLYIVSELIDSLNRGYQLHVLSYTLWDLLRSLHEQGKVQTAEVDSCVPQLVQVFNEELFGQVAEEKEVAGITDKFMEAKQMKSYDSYALLARYVSKTTLPQLIVPLKQVCDSTHRHSHTKKATEALRRVASGLVVNTGLDLESTLTFIYGLVTQTVPGLNIGKGEEKKSGDDVIPSRFVTETFIVPKEPGRGDSKPKAHAVTNAHIIVDFGLQVLYLLLKKSVIHSSNTSHLSLVDPFIEQLAVCLASKHVKVTITTLRCLLWLLRLPLPSLKQHVVAISNHLFVLINKYACVGAATSDDNFDLVLQSFKVMAVLVRNVEYHTIGTDQLKVLLTYVEQDIHDFTRQGAAFTLLKAIIHRKLVTPEINDVIVKVEQLSIQSQAANVRQQCRQVASAFLMDYPVGEKLKKHLEFYIMQLEYEFESGRESALEMLVSMFNVFPPAVLVAYSGFFFVPLATRLVNDDSAACRRQAQLAIKQLLVKLDTNQRDVLFNMCVTWMQESQVLVRKMAAISCAAFVSVEATAFQRHLPTLLPIIEHQIHPDKYGADVTSEHVQEYDHLLYNMLNLLCKILRDCDVIGSNKYTTDMVPIWDHVRVNCEHAHMWVKLAAAQLFGLYFAAWKPEQLLQTAVNERDVTAKKRQKVEEDEDDEERKGRDEVGYLCSNLDEKLHVLCGSFCTQLTLVEQDTDLADQVIKNLVFIGKVLIAKETQESVTQNAGNATSQPRKRHRNTQDDTSQVKDASLSWLLRKLCREAKREAAVTPTNTIMRSSVFKWLAAVGLELGAERIQPCLPTMLGPLVREYTDSSTHEDAELKKLSAEVLDLLKKVCGVEMFSTVFATIQKQLTDRRHHRRQTKAAEFVTQPEIAAMRKVKKNLSKRDAQKRKIRQNKPYKNKKRKTGK